MARWSESTINQDGLTHTCGDRTPYVYWIWCKNPFKVYIGMRECPGCHPDDLMVVYFSSSCAEGGLVNFVMDGGEISHFDTMVCDSVTEARKIEKQLIKQMQEKYGSDCLNKKLTGGGHTGKKHSKETKEKIRQSLLGKSHSAEFGRKISACKIGRPRKQLYRRGTIKKSGYCNNTRSLL